MRKLAIILCLVSGVMAKTTAEAQEANTEKDDKVIYTVAINIVPDGFNAPLFGFVNIAQGNHSSVHLGFVNMNYWNFQGAQFSFFNTVGMATRGGSSWVC